MSEKIVQLNEEIIKGQIRELVRGSVEETLNERLNREIRRRTRVVGTFPDGNSPPEAGLREAAPCGGDAVGL